MGQKHYFMNRFISLIVVYNQQTVIPIGISRNQLGPLQILRFDWLNYSLSIGDRVYMS